MRRVVVTGMGAITPIGLSVDDFWNGVREQRTGFGPITKFDAGDYKCKLAAEVKGFVAKEFMDFKAAKRMDSFSQYAVAAAKEAVAQSGLDMEKEDPYMVGCSVGSGIGSLQALEREHSKLLERGPGRVNPLFGSSDDLQHGLRKCVYLFWVKGKEYQCGNRLCNGNPFHRRGLSQHSVQRGGRDGGGRYGKLHLSHRDCRIYRSLPPFPAPRTRPGVPSPLTKREADSSWEKGRP